jgi:hypothetical protein
MGGWDKKLIAQVLGILLSALLALLSVAGYHVVVVNPELQAMHAQVIESACQVK